MNVLSHLLVFASVPSKASMELVILNITSGAVVVVVVVLVFSPLSSSFALV